MDASVFSLLFCFNLPLLVVYWYWCRKHVRNMRHALAAMAVIALECFGLLGWKIADSYTGLGINEVALLHASKGMEGLQWQMALPLCIALFLVSTLVILACRALWRAVQDNVSTVGNRGNPGTESLALLFSLALLVLNPGYAQTAQVLEQAWQARRLVANVMEGAQLPAPVPAGSRQHPLSAIYIYAEGLESAFLDPQKFPGLMPQLNRLGDRGLRIRGIHQVALTGWTIAGQMASHCGFPGSRNGEEQFVDDATRFPCIGDLLAADGYALSYLNGSALEFAGKGTFWKTHGYQRQLGDKDILQLAATPSAQTSEWGAYDDTLTTAAWNEYRRLLLQRETTGQPFVLTMLTVDTHAPNGLDTPACRALPEPPVAREHFAKALHCADYLIGSFIQRILADNAADVVVVLQSDHLQPPLNDMIRSLGSTDHRDDLWMAWGHGIAPGVLQRQATMFDAAPTFLGLLGRQPIALNLGRDLRGNAPTLAEQHGYPWVEQHMKAALLDARMANTRLAESLHSHLHPDNPTAPIAQ